LLINSVSSTGADVVMKLKKTRDRVVVSAAEKESERGKECGFLDPKFLKATCMSDYILPIEVKYS
jgi:hypothetical protein